MDDILTYFQDEVTFKYNLYNSLFLTLPFQKMQEVGALLALFSTHCTQELKKEKNPQQIISEFFKKSKDQIKGMNKMNLLLIMLQFIERQVVLFDALEDAAFKKTHLTNGPGSLTYLLNKISHPKYQKNFIQHISDYRVRIVLTAHPTQFYPSPVLGIINQLTQAIQKNDSKTVSNLLWQMGKTSFKNPQKPTPFQEAHGLIWYVENIFYRVIPDIQQQIDHVRDRLGDTNALEHPVVELGFWPGSDRDGNPYVTPQTTLQVAKLLKTRVLKLYSHDLQRLSKKLTFPGILNKLVEIKNTIDNTYWFSELDSQDSFEPSIYKKSSDFLSDLLALRNNLITDHDSLFIDDLDQMIIKVRCFGFHLASMDMREDSSMHRKTFQAVIKDLGSDFKHYNRLSHHEKIKQLSKLYKRKARCKITDRTIDSMKTIQSIQNSNGEKGLCRYIISNTQSELDVLELLILLRLTGQFGANIPVDVIPLFESMADLEHSTDIMTTLYQCDFYQKHLAHRGQTQTIMLGFSDGTKDGGYVAANWSIYQAKINLTNLSKQYGIRVIFFDGRGGPPARGGGSTHQFYRSLGGNIQHKDLQLTIQGQTISSNFGTKISAKYNIEQFFTAGIDDLLFPSHTHILSEKDCKILQAISDSSTTAYQNLKKNPLFVPYLEEITPLKFYSELNIGSRPTTRKKSKQLQLSDLRAIPFVNAWSQLKQNIPGYYGFGSALKTLMKAGQESALVELYQDSLFFRTLVENTLMSLSKTYFPLTAYLKKDKKFGHFWACLRDEAILTEKLLLKISGQKILLDKDPLNRESIKMREQIVLPALIIQQFALFELRKLTTKDSDLSDQYLTIILKSLATNTNASRNAA